MGLVIQGGCKATQGRNAECGFEGLNDEESRGVIVDERSELVPGCAYWGGG